MAKVLKVVSFGSAKGGLATIGYTVYGIDGVVIANRSTDGVVEIGTNTGIYAAPIDMPDYDAIVLWDTGEGSPRYATEDYQYGVDAIRGNTERIEQIWNKLKNYDLTLSTLLDKIGWLQKNEGLQKINEQIKLLSAKENPTINEIKNVLDKSILDIKFPDVSQLSGNLKALPELSSKLSALQSSISKIPVEKQKDYSVYFNNLSKHLLNISEHFTALKGVFTKIDGVVSRIEELNAKLGSLDSNDKDSSKTTKQIIAEVDKLSRLIYAISTSAVVKDFQEANNMLYAFGHLRGK